MKKLRDQVREFCDRDEEFLLETRRHLHRHPELSFVEYNTSDYLSARLTESGIPHKKIIDTGILAVIEGKDPGKKMMALRGDIDALPIQEETGLPFASVNSGVMHACGHDIHSTCVLGAARILHGLRDRFEGSVKVIFQPGEEKLPGGASKLLDTGELKTPPPSSILGQHVYPELESGKIGLRPGLYMASADEIYITLRGPGGHAALPDKTVDLIYAASQLIQQLQQVVSRNAPPLIPSVLTFGHIEGLGATNVIPAKVAVAGTFRTLDETWRARAHERIREIVDAITLSTGARYELEIRKGYPHLYNNPGLTDRIRGLAVEFLGEENVVDLDIRMTSEDFAYYSHAFEACFYRLGVRKPGGEITNLHTPVFNADEDAIKTGTAFMAYAAIRTMMA